MKLFISNYTNKIDKKGRVSVPSQFRQVLSVDNHSQIFVYPSFINPCIEACSSSRIEELSNFIDNLDPFSEQKDAFATTILGGSVALNIDSDGRVLIPADMVEEFNLYDNVTFVGKGPTFEIWQPQLFKEYSEKAREIALNNRASLRNINKKGAGDA